MQKNNNKKNPKHIFSFSLGENTVKTELSYSVPSLHKNSSHVATQTKLFIPAFLSANAFYEFAPASHELKGFWRLAETQTAELTVGFFWSD